MAQQNLSGKVVVITGASSGFGKAAVRRFAKEGCSVVLAARRKSLLEELAH
jgi:NADP-dependent 3-hydroxy acid dehydrogenase YdfG